MDIERIKSELGTNLYRFVEGERTYDALQRLVFQLELLTMECVKSYMKRYEPAPAIEVPVKGKKK